MSEELNLTDEDFEASLLDTGEETPADPAEVSTEEATGTGAEPSAEQEVSADAAQPESEKTRWEPEGPTDPRAWAHHAREAQRKAEAELAAIKAERDAAIQKAREEAHQAALEERLAYADPEEAKAILAEETERQKQILESQYAEKAFQEQVAWALENVPDYRQQIQKALNHYGPEFEEMAQKKGVRWAYEQAKKIQTPEEIQAQVKAGVEKALSELAAKQKEPETKGHKTIAHATSAVSDAPGKKSVKKMSDDQLESFLMQ